MKCRVCRGEIVIELPRHNAAFCAEHFLTFCRGQVERAVKDFSMIESGDRCLVAVSGGKDSLAIWDLLLDLGYEADGLYVGLGIGEYSDDSGHHARAFAEQRGQRLIEVDLREEYGFDVPSASAATGRVACSACGLSKRHLFDKAALDGNYDVLVTGHNLDDEAAVLYGNVLRWQTDYLSRQRPVLPAGNGLPKKVKPLVRLSERETAAYCVVRGIDYQVDECPMAAGNKHLAYKESLNLIEETSPGAKNAFYFEFQRKAIDAFATHVANDHHAGPGSDGTEAGSAQEVAITLRSCIECGATSSAEVCAFCRLARSATARADPSPTRSHSTTPTSPESPQPRSESS